MLKGTCWSYWENAWNKFSWSVVIRSATCFNPKNMVIDSTIWNERNLKVLLNHLFYLKIYQYWHVIKANYSTLIYLTMFYQYIKICLKAFVKPCLVYLDHVFKKIYQHWHVKTTNYSTLIYLKMFYHYIKICLKVFVKPCLV